MISTRLLFFCLATTISIQANAADPLSRSLMHDPFMRPTFALPAVPANPANQQMVNAHGAIELPFPLLMVVNAGPRSVVNAGGKILKLREKLEGYQLISVGDSKATFVKDGVRYEAEIGKEIKK
jgi:hypothetical protein